ncbi:CIS tube protein [Shewanella surugensis]|uniref:Peptidoglycan-binding protein n=1 Tax=Shewanella surugensis TaxID=212020 RepID=A0ABT0L8P1_9GAMM|nr:peptidoglycan-binding protein [Shewanella surugensis]MCL1123745.1 peptidoglycan-binding protein [Shewanella surugensis]
MAQKLTIETQDKSSQFEVMINPNSVNHHYVIKYDDSKNKPLGTSGLETKFAGYNSENLDFNITIDGTGVVKTKSAVDVATQITQLKKVIYDYIGDIHQPNIVNVIWGTFHFVCRLTNFKVEYTLFKPDGTPLRAKIQLAFIGYMSSKEEALKAKRSSPDLSHIIDVKVGDTLPLLCHQVYQDSSYYIDIARINDLTHFRPLTPGSQLYFPPLD